MPALHMFDNAQIETVRHVLECYKTILYQLLTTVASHLAYRSRFLELHTLGPLCVWEALALVAHAEDQRGDLAGLGTLA